MKEKTHKPCLYCNHWNKVEQNVYDYVLVMCEKCENLYFVKPLDEKMQMIIGKKPSEKHLLFEDDIKELIDIHLSVRDLEQVRIYNDMLNQMKENGEEYVIFDLKNSEGEEVK